MEFTNIAAIDRFIVFFLREFTKVHFFFFFFWQLDFQQIPYSLAVVKVVLEPGPSWHHCPAGLVLY